MSTKRNIAFDSAGTVYVSDMFAGKVFKIGDHEVSTYLDNLRGPAGLLVAGSDMYVFTGDGLMKANAEKTLTTISKGMDGRANGIVMVNDCEFILTSGGGVVYYVYGDGSNQVLFDTRERGIAAGINLYDPTAKVMYMTTDDKNYVVAYRLR